MLPAGSWLSIILIYLFGVLTSASLSKIIPVLGDLAQHRGASPAQLALLISLMTVAPAVLASAAGSIIDRLGARTALQLVALVGTAVNLGYLLTGSLQGFMVMRVVEGLIAVGGYSAAPALIMATTSDGRRGRAMALWSTYTPVGMSLGLLMSGSFAGTADWMGGYRLHLMLFAALLLLSPLLPALPARVPHRARRAGLLSVWTEAGPLRLSLAFAALVVMGFGVSTVYPEWFSRHHDVPVGQASRILGVLNLAMIPGGLLAGAALARGVRDARLLTVLMLATLVVSLPLFQPGLVLPLRYGAMLLWLMTQGAAIAVVMSALPRVVVDPAQGAAAAGLLSQLAALVTFVTPLVWQPILHSGRWPWFVVVVAASAATAWWLFPRRTVSRA